MVASPLLTTNRTLKIAVFAAALWVSPGAATAVAAGGQNQLSRVEWREDGGSATVLSIRGSATPTFTLYKLEKPERLVVDVANADAATGIAGLDGPAQVGTWSVNQVMVQELGGQESGVARFVVTFARPSIYAVAAKGNDVVVTVTARAARPQAPATTASADVARLSAEAALAKRQAEEARADAAKARQETEDARRAAAAATDGATRREADAAKRVAAAEAARDAADRKAADAETRAAGASVRATDAAKRIATAEAAEKRAAAKIAEAEKRDDVTAKREAEVERRRAESDRKAAELAARSAESDRKAAELAARGADSDRKAAEAERRTAAAAQATADASRRQAEAQRKETDVAAREKAATAQIETAARAAEDADRRTREADARLAEAVRASKDAEAAKKAATELKRTAERALKDTEGRRDGAEQTRKAAEARRVEAERTLTAAQARAEAAEKSGAADAVKRRTEAEAALARLEARRKEAELAAQTAEARTAEAQQRRSESEARQREAELAATSAEERKLSAERARNQADQERKVAEGARSQADQERKVAEGAKQVAVSAQKTEEARVRALATARAEEERRLAALATARVKEEDAAKRAEAARVRLEAQAKDAADALAKVQDARRRAVAAKDQASETERAKAAAQAKADALAARAAARAEIDAAKAEVAKLEQQRVSAERAVADRNRELAGTEQRARAVDGQRAAVDREVSAARKDAQVARVSRETEEGRVSAVREELVREEARLAEARRARTAEESKLAAVSKTEEARLAATRQARAEEEAKLAAVSKATAEARVAAAAPVVPAAAPVSVKPAPVRAVAMTASTPAPSGPVRIRDISLVDGAASARVVLELQGNAQPVVVAASGRQAILDIPGADLPKALERVLDANRAGGPVRRVSSYRDPRRPDRVRVVVELATPSEGVLHRATSKEGTTWTWDFARTAPQSSGKIVARSNTWAPPVVGAYGVATTPITSQTVAQKRTKVYRGKRIDLNFKDVDIHNLLRLLAEVGGVNVVVPDDVKASVTVRLTNVPWDQAMEVVLASKELWYRREGNLIRVAQRKQLDAEDQAEAERQRARASSEAPEPEVFTLNYATAADMSAQVGPLLSPKGKVEVDTRTNSLIINDIRAHRERAIALLSRLDTQTPQIQIEARVVEARSNWSRAIGVQWGHRITSTAGTGNPTGLIFPSDFSSGGGAVDNQTQSGGVLAASPDFGVNLPAATGTGAGGAVGFAFGSLGGNFNLTLRLSAAEDTGTVRIVSAPKVTVLNNAEATISQGVSIPISVVSAQGVQTQFVNADLKLKATPHVSQRDCSILMNLEVTKNEADFVNTGARGDPSILRKEAKTTMLISDGETTVIGGIYTRNSGMAYAKVPYLADIPILGWFFKSRTENDERSEVLIFLTPKITNRASLRCEAKRR